MTALALWRVIAEPLRRGRGEEGIVDPGELPLDDPPPPADEGDDSFHGPAADEQGPEPEPRGGPVPDVVPLPRILRRAMRGKDVLAVQRALATQGLRRWGTFTVSYGQGTENQVREFQRRHDLEVDGEYGEDTHRAMVAAKGFDQYGARLMASANTAPSGGQRGSIVHAALLAHLHRDQIHYTQGAQRMQGVRDRIRLPGYPHWEDCSSFATWVYWQAGAPDPNGPSCGYNGLGFTGTQVSNPRGRVIALDQARPGDLVFYGGTPAVPGHVAVYAGGGRVVSHGSEAGPLLLPVAYRPINQVRSYL